MTGEFFPPSFFEPFYTHLACFLLILARGSQSARTHFHEVFGHHYLRNGLSITPFLIFIPAENHFRVMKMHFEADIVPASVSIYWRIFIQR